MTGIKGTERLARSVNGPYDDETGGFYAEVGRMFSSTGCKVAAIKITRDGHGPMGHYDRITVWSDRAELLAEMPMHMAESVVYVGVS